MPTEDGEERRSDPRVRVGWYVNAKCTQHLYVAACLPDGIHSGSIVVFVSDEEPGTFKALALSHFIDQTRIGAFAYTSADAPGSLSKEKKKLLKTIPPITVRL